MAICQSNSQSYLEKFIQVYTQNQQDVQISLLILYCYIKKSPKIQQFNKIQIYHATASWVKNGQGTAESSSSCSSSQSASQVAFSSGGLTGEESALNLICFRVSRRTSVCLVSQNKVLYNVTVKIVKTLPYAVT